MGRVGVLQRARNLRKTMRYLPPPDWPSASHPPHKNGGGIRKSELQRRAGSQLRNRSAADDARGVVARGFPRQAGLANHEFTLEPRLLDLIGGLLLCPAIPRLEFALGFGHGSFALPFFARMLLGPQLNRLSVLGRRGVKAVPRGRSSGNRSTTGSQRAAICQAQGRNNQHDGFVNHGDRPWRTRSPERCSRKPDTNRGAPTKIFKSRAVRGRPN